MRSAKVGSREELGLGPRDYSAEDTACQDFLRRISRARKRGRAAPSGGSTTGGLGHFS